MKEYEYSFKVESIEPYIEYCKQNKYRLQSVSTQNRIVYENKHYAHMIARITKTTKNGKTKTLFDCKNVNHKNGNLNVSSESIPITVTNQNRKSIESMLEVLDFYEAANNQRTRYVYEKDNIIFEIDDYINPKMQVVAIEGKQEEVDNIYQEIKESIHNILSD